MDTSFTKINQSAENRLDAESYANGARARKRPIHIVRRGAKEHFYFYVARHGAKWYVPLGNDRAAAEAQADRYLAGEPLPPRKDEARRARVFSRRLADSLAAALSRARNRAKSRGLEFTLTASDLDRMMKAQGGRCAVTGIEFDVSPVRQRTTHMQPYRPSIDRVNAGKGYTPQNCRIVCFAVNVALSDWGDDVFLRIARAAVEHAPNRR